MNETLLMLSAVGIIIVGYVAYDKTYRWVTGKDPYEVYMKELHEHPIFGPAYRSALQEDGGRPGFVCLGVLRAYDGRDGIG